jgi:hypothetical protein
MRRLGLAAALALAAACAPSRDDLTVDWTFAGKTCADAGVAFIEVHIDGEVLSPDKFTCAEAGKGAYLGRYLIGRYTLTVSGLDASSSVIYQTSVQVDVRRGGTEVAVDAAPSTTTGSATLHWTFDGKSCAAAGVTVINASVDNQVLTDVNNNADLPCSQAGVDGVTVEPLSPGQHSFDLVGKVAGTIKYALNGFTVNVIVGQNTSASPNLLPAAPTTASANLTWAFNGMSCAAANVDHVQIRFDPLPDGSGGLDSGTVVCNTGGVDGAAVDGVPEGTHSFAITGIRLGHIVYFTHHPPSTIFRVGLISDLFVPAESP